MRLRVGVYGLRHPHSAAHVRELQLMEEVEEIVVVDEDESALTPYRGAPKIVEALSSLEPVLRRDDIPIFFVFKPNDESAVAMERVVSAGKHVIADKPAARTSEELRRVLAAADRRGVQVGVYYQSRWHPMYRQLRELRQAGVIGRVVSVVVRFIASGFTVRDPRSWIYQRARSGGGILHWLGCHYIDLMHYLVGERIERVSAMVGTTGDTPIDVEDVAAVTLEFAGGAIATLHCGYLLQRSRAGGPTQSYDQAFAIYGSKGRAWTEADDTLVVESAVRGWDDCLRREFRYQIPESEAYAGVYGMEFLRAFFRAFLEGGPSPCSGEEALRVLAVIEAAYEAAASGRTVGLRWG